MDKTVPSDELKEHHNNDFVYLHAPFSCGLVPSISPFVLKLETWLRMEDIPYKVLTHIFMSKRFLYIVPAGCYPIEDNGIFILFWMIHI